MPGRLVYLTPEQWADLTTAADERPARVAELRAALDKCLKYLTARQRAVVEGVFWRGMTQRELAAELGISQQVVSEYLRAALKKLREKADFQP